MTEVCSGKLDHKQYYINDNKWGNRNATQCIYKNGNTLGWRWNNSGGVNYPAIVVGTNFCSWKSLWNKFPIKWKDIKSWNIDLTWNYPKQPTKDWNLSFDIYFWDTSNCGADSHKKMNNMVWIQGGGGLFSPDRNETITVDGKSYWVDYPWKHWGGSWHRRNFVLKNGPTGSGSYKVDLKKLLATQTDLNGDWTIDSIHFGNENSGGSSGQINITKFDMEINGSKISLGGTSTTPTPSPTTTPTPSPSQPSNDCKDGVYIKDIGCIKYIVVLIILLVILLLRRE